MKLQLKLLMAVTDLQVDTAAGAPERIMHTSCPCCCSSLVKLQTVKADSKEDFHTVQTGNNLVPESVY